MKCDPNKTGAESSAADESHSLPDTRLRVGSLLLERSQIACNRGHYEMAVFLPPNECVKGTGRSQQEAFVSFCTQVSGLLFPEPTEKQLEASTPIAKAIEALHSELAQREEGTRAATRTKARQKTVGVTSKTSLVNRIGADRESDNFSSSARELFERGLNILDERLESESSASVFGDFQRAYASLSGTETTQWMLRVDRKVYERALVLANEYERSLSSLAATCIAYAMSQ